MPNAKNRDSNAGTTKEVNPIADKPDGKREGPGGLFWIAVGVAGFFVAIIGDAFAGFVPHPLHGLLLGVPLGILVGTAAYSARQRHRGCLVLGIIVTGIVAAWIAILAMESYEAHRPTPLF
jgi:hypothetical protein